MAKLEPQVVIDLQRDADRLFKHLYEYPKAEDVLCFICAMNRILKRAVKTIKEGEKCDMSPKDIRTVSEMWEEYNRFCELCTDEPKYVDKLERMIQIGVIYLEKFIPQKKPKYWEYMNDRHDDDYDE